VAPCERSCDSKLACWCVSFSMTDSPTLRSSRSTSSTIRRESELVREFLPNIAQHAALSVRRRWTVAQETQLERLIPDVIAIGTRGRPHLEWTQRLSYTQASILDYLEQAPQPMRAEELAEQLFIRPHVLSGALSTLSKWKLVRRSSTGELRVSKLTGSNTTEIVAIEAKLARWRDALRQAVEYLAFANRAYVVLDDLTARDKPAAFSEFREWGVGLILRDEATFSRALPARLHTPRSALRILAIARTLSRGIAEPA